MQVKPQEKARPDRSSHMIRAAPETRGTFAVFRFVDAFFASSAGGRRPVFSRLSRPRMRMMRSCAESILARVNY